MADIGITFISGRVVTIANRDTLTLLDARSTHHKVRLSGIDAPERGQPFGTVSGHHLGMLVFGKLENQSREKENEYRRKIIIPIFFREVLVE